MSTGSAPEGGTAAATDTASYASSATLPGTFSPTCTRPTPVTPRSTSRSSPSTGTPSRRTLRWPAEPATRASSATCAQLPSLRPVALWYDTRPTSSRTPSTPPEVTNTSARAAPELVRSLRKFTALAPARLHRAHPQRRGQVVDDLRQRGVRPGARTVHGAQGAPGAVHALTRDHPQPAASRPGREITGLEAVAEQLRGARRRRGRGLYRLEAPHAYVVERQLGAAPRHVLPHLHASDPRRSREVRRPVETGHGRPVQAHVDAARGGIHHQVEADPMARLHREPGGTVVGHPADVVAHPEHPGGGEEHLGQRPPRHLAQLQEVDGSGTRQVHRPQPHLRRDLLQARGQHRVGVGTRAGQRRHDAPGGARTGARIHHQAGTAGPGGEIAGLEIVGEEQRAVGDGRWDLRRGAGRIDLPAARQHHQHRNDGDAGGSSTVVHASPNRRDSPAHRPLPPRPCRFATHLP